MKFGRLYAVLALVAFAVLGGAAVWMGALNQDEGWYLYAAQMVSEGHLPYRDFFYTQGPVLPFVYAAFASAWHAGGMLGGRLLTLGFGALSLVFAVALVQRLVPPEKRTAAGLIAFFLLGSNLYHIYYLAIPKTYALAATFVMAGFLLLAVALEKRAIVAVGAGLALALAAGTRISLGALLAVVGVALLWKGQWKVLVAFAIGGAAGLALVYGPFLCDEQSLKGLLAAQEYHAARSGFDIVWVVGSLSRLVRWYLPVFVMLGLIAFGTRQAKPVGVSFLPGVILAGFLAVFAVQMMAPFPYEDYQVPVMGLLAVFAAAQFALRAEDETKLGMRVLLALGLTWGTTFGSPLLEKWTTNGQDRFWSLKKTNTELAQLREVAREINELDPGGKTLLTQDLYLAIETGRSVPHGLEMGPFAMLSSAEWRSLLDSAPCPIAALSGYSFAILPPKCDERPMSEQMEFWSILKRKYALTLREDHFGQNQTTLLILKRK